MKIFKKKKIKSDKDKYRLLQHIGKVYDSLDDEEIIDAIDENIFFINPDSIYIYIFDSIIVILSFYCLFYFPYYLAHDSFMEFSKFNFKNFLFNMIDLFYITDLIISFFRAYYNYEEILMQNYIDMSYHYFKSWFFLDLLAAIPFYSIIFFIEKNNKNIELSNNFNSLSYLEVKLHKIHYLLILNKITKIFKCFSDNNRALSKFFEKLYKNDKIEEKSNIFFIIFILLSACNFGACLLIFIGRNSYPSWMNEIQYNRNSFSSLYICSIYYLITTITTVGYGDIYGRTIPEILLQIILLIAGTCTYSYVISSVSNHIQKISEKSLIFENKLKILNDIKITHPLMDIKLYEKILRFLRYKKKTEKDKQEIIINSLPESLKNLLIIEMYKPIIKHFMIFKGLENSNCIVQLVTAFKPIYAIKNDIIIQEGDFIEEVIFVKKGVISLEIGIDLNNPKESIIKYLKGNNEKDKSIYQNNFGILNFAYETIKHSSTLYQNRKTIKKEIKSTHYLKVLEIRKNEHFGETLMFLNERSPLNAKVKSIKAELFLLKKEEVIKIFNTFPNIWNRINEKSIYNMKQIKRIVKTVLLKFSSMIGININDDLFNKKNKTPKKNIKNSSKTIKKSLIIEERKTNNEKDDKNIQNEENKEIDNRKNINNSISTSSLIKSFNSLNDVKILHNSQQEDFKNKLEKNDNKGNLDENSFSRILSFEKSNNITIISKDNTVNFESNPKLTTQISQYNSISQKMNHYQSNDTKEFTNKKTSNNNCFSCFKELKKISNFESDKKMDINNKHNNSIETIKITMNKKLYSLSDCESLKEEKQNNYEKENYYINDEVYENEIFDLNCKFKDDLLKQNSELNFNPNDKIKIEKLSNKILEKTWIKNLDKEKYDYLEKILIQPKEKENSLLKELRDNKKEILNSCYVRRLKITNNESFLIKSTYENINEITGNKYIKNNALRNKTKEFLVKECLYGNENVKKKSDIKISTDFSCFKNLINDKKNIFKINGKLINRESDKIMSHNESLFKCSEKSKKYSRRGSLPNFKLDNRINKISDKTCNIRKMEFSKKALSLSNNFSPIIKRAKNSRLSVRINNKADNLNHSSRLSNRLNDEKEMSFYDKYSICNLNNDNIEEKVLLKKKKKHDSDLDEIKQIIQQDAQKLNQPALYYQNLFLNQIQKSKDCKDCNQTNFPIKNIKTINNVNNVNIRRISTSKEQNVKTKLGVSFKRNKNPI